MKKIYAASIIAIITLFVSCDDIAGLILTAGSNVTEIVTDLPPVTPVAVPPFVISRPVFEIIGRTNYFNYGGMVFKFLNQRGEYVERITVSFRLFDPKTHSNPFFTTNKFEISKWDFVNPNENKEIIISMDQYIYVAPSEPYIIDFFYVSEILYGDGSVWRDKNGIYRIRE
jgi:hypothetical protein